MNSSESSPPTRRFAGFDIETLSLDLNAVVYQLGVATLDLPREFHTTTDHIYGMPLVTFLDQYVFTGITLYSVYVDILPQTLRFKHVDPGTLDFHRGVSERAQGRVQEEPEFISSYLGQGRSDHPTIALELLQGWLSSPEELWINHPSFDVPRTRLLAKDFQYPGDLWNYRSERDVATIKASFKRLPFPGIYDTLVKVIDHVNGIQHKHQAQYDARYNLLWGVAGTAILNQLAWSWSSSSNHSDTVGNMVSDLRKILDL